MLVLSLAVIFASHQLLSDPISLINIFSVNIVDNFTQTPDDYAAINAVPPPQQFNLGAIRSITLCGVHKCVQMNWILMKSISCMSVRAIRVCDADFFFILIRRVTLFHPSHWANCRIFGEALPTQ